VAFSHCGTDLTSRLKGDFSTLRTPSTLADSRLDPSTQRLGSTNLVKQPPCEAVLGLTRHRKEQVFGSDDGVASRRSEFVGFTQQFFDASSEFSHRRIMTGPRGTFPNAGSGETPALIHPPNPTR
jgi:hypothetical protein